MSAERILMNPHKAAALAYGGLGIVVIVVTFAAELVPATRRDAVGSLVVGTGFVLVFAALLYWRGWWLLSALLVVSNLWRATNYVGHGLGLHVDPLGAGITAIPPRPVAFVNAALMAVIVLLLARSARIGFAGWRQRGRVGGES